MARLLIYDAYENKVYTYANLNENDPMPYSTLTTLRLREFRGKSASPTLWTTIAAMEAWNLTRRKYGRGIPVGYAFRRIWEGGHGTRRRHPGMQRHHRRLPHPAPGQPGLLCHGFAGRTFHPWLPDRQPYRRHLWCPHRAGAARLPETHQPAGGRRMRLRQLEKDLHRRHRHRTYQNHH